MLTRHGEDRAEDSKRLAGMAQTRAKTVINLLQAPPPPEPRQILLQVKFAAIDRVALSQIGFNLFSTNDKLIGARQHAAVHAAALQPVAGQDGSRRPDGQLLRPAEPLRLPARPEYRRHHQGPAGAQSAADSGRAEPDHAGRQGRELPGGRSFPFPTITTTPTGGATAPVITVQFKPFGVKLDFTPTVTPQGSIDLKVAPEVSSLDFANAVTLQGFPIPALSQRRAETEVVLKDGESFAIAGLIDNRVIETMDKVPGLGDLPILGKTLPEPQHAEIRRTNCWWWSRRISCGR